MSRRVKEEDPLSSGVLVFGQQLRREVPGGIGTYTRSLIAGAARLAQSERPPLRLFASRSPVRPDPLEELGIPVDTSWLSPFLLDRGFEIGMPRIGRDASVVHAVSLAVPPTSVPLTVALHDIAFRSVPDAYPRHGLRWHERALRRVARHAAFCIVPSIATKNAVRDSGVGIGEDRMEIVEYGSDHLPDGDTEATAGVLRRLGVGGDFLMTVGTLEPRKNLIRLFDAYGLARAKLDEAWPLVVVGPVGWGKGAIRPPKGVVFAGEVAPSVLAGLYERARIVAYVPLIEGFGLPVAEAMRAGAAVVSSPVPSSGGAAFEVDPTDVEEIAAALVAVGNDGELHDRLVAAGRERARSLTWEETARRHVTIWRRVANGAS